MNFFSLLYREWLWWRRTPSIWLALPLSIMLLCMTPWYFGFLFELRTNMRLAQMDGILSVALYSIKMFANDPQWSTTLQWSPFAPILPMLQNFKVEDIWYQGLIPAIQFWGALCTSITLPPIAVALFIRDRNCDFYQRRVMQKQSIFQALLAKLVVCLVLRLPIYVAAMMLTGTWFASHSNYAAAFYPWSFPWIITWLILPTAFGALHLSLSWLICAFSRNGASENYLSMIICSCLPMLLLPWIFESGWNPTIQWKIVAICSALSLLILILLSQLMKRERFLCHRIS